MNQTQKEQILEYLKKNKTITTLESVLKLMITDPQHYIMELRREGYKITDKWIINPKTKKHYKEYRLES